MIEHILLCGNRSFVATGLKEKLTNAGFRVDCFSRGKEEKIKDQVTGDILAINNNKLFKTSYDVIINFIILKDKGVKENIDYMASLVKFCEMRRIKKLIHISSIMVYNNNESYIDETTAIENNSPKKGYGEIKIAVDKYIENLKDLPFTITLIRPGYVLANNTPCPFIKKLPLGITLIKGDKKSIQPIVRREDIHNALLNMITNDRFDPVFLFTPNNSITKYRYAQKKEGGLIIALPKWLILGMARILLFLKMINPALFVRIEGMYIRSIYNSTQTQSRLNIKF